MSDLKSQIVAKALELGFADCRIAPARPATHREIYEQWVAEGKYGDMAWMARNMDRRTDPTIVQPGAKTVIVLAMNYYQGKAPDSAAGGYRIARYAWNEDYHDLITKKLKELDAFLIEKGGTQRYYVDTGPVLERDFASEAGLGWGGKSTMQIHREYGTWFFLAELISTLDLPVDTPARDLCGKCTRCIDACPTEAILAPFVIDANKCISYLTIELRDEIDKSFKNKMDNWMFGCDVCQDVCPWNRFSTPHTEPRFKANEQLLNMKKEDWLDITEDVFKTIFKNSAVKRTKFKGLDRNIRFL